MELQHTQAADHSQTSGGQPARPFSWVVHAYPVTAALHFHQVPLHELPTVQPLTVAQISGIREPQQQPAVSRGLSHSVPRATVGGSP